MTILPILKPQKLRTKTSSSHRVSGSLQKPLFFYGGQMILFLFFACEEPECLELQEPREQHNVEQMHSSGQDFDTGELEDTAYDTGGEQ